MSSLSPVNSPVSSPEVGLHLGLTSAPGRPGTALPPGGQNGDGDDDEDEEEADEDEWDLQELGSPPQDISEKMPSPNASSSNKTLPSTQPKPEKALGNFNGQGYGRPTQGGKGKKGEEALESAVAAREEVERRRVEIREERSTQGPRPGAPAKTAARGAVSGSTGIADAGDGMETEVVSTVKEEEEVTGEPEEEAEDLGGPIRRERPALAEERADIIRFSVVTNDGSPSSLIILTGLKNIFQKQLPKMPREYIARLVFDRNHYSMAIVKRGLEVVGGITYRPFEARKFAEIVFCAITGTEQVKGYGSHLMNHLKDYVKSSTQCRHFLTYADNYAIGYFKKQGFTKEVGLDRSVWAGYIKDYEGGTIMHCSMLERVKYLEVATMLAKQKEVILAEIRLLSESHIVHPGLGAFTTLAPGTSLDPSQVPGLKESGWTPEMDELTRRPKRGPQFAVMQRILTLLVDHPSAWAFANPVNAAEVTDYYDTIKEPMDLATMDRKLESNTYNSLTEFLYDAKLIFDNCRAYNDSGSNYVKNANKLEAYLNEQVKVYLD